MLMIYGQRHASRIALQELEQATRYELGRYTTNLETLLEKYQSIPHLLSIDARLHAYLANRQDATAQQDINAFLEQVNRISHASVIYLMDPEGNTLASSNWRLPSSFVGHNFGYRPYFQTALLSRHGRYFAIGSTSHKRGYYFSSPLTDSDEVLGVIVLKIDLDGIEESWSDPWGKNPYEVMVTDEDGVVFMSTRPQWRYKTLTPLDAKARATLDAHRRYDGVQLSTLRYTRTPLSEAAEDAAHRVTLSSVSEASGETKPPGVERFLALSRHMPEAQWQVQILSPYYGYQKDVAIILFSAGTGYLLIILGVFYLRERRWNEQKLLQAKGLLESRVQERTQDLSESNLRLRQEVDERQRAEKALRQAQDELIQAAKLAVLGQLSAGINHELNQPLTAIRTFAQNARIFYDRNHHAQVEDNLKEIIELTDHMAQIVAQFKVFSRKEKGKLEPVNLEAAVRAALNLLDTPLREHRITVTQFPTPAPAVMVSGNMVWVEQVLVNLINNGIQAMTAQSERVMTIDLTTTAHQIELSVRDRGPGLTEEGLVRVFEPFYTTKDISEGLGLGLPISRQIMELMQGKLTASNHPDGGAVFHMIFPIPTGDP